MVKIIKVWFRDVNYILTGLEMVTLFYTISIWTDRPDKKVKTQIRHHNICSGSILLGTSHHETVFVYRLILVFVSCCKFLMKHEKMYLTTGLALWVKSSADDILNLFSYFSQTQNLNVHANCLHCRQFAWNVKTCFLGKNRKIVWYVICWNFYKEYQVLRCRFFVQTP